MENQNSKNGKVHKMTQETKLPSNPEEFSMIRTTRLTKALFEAINNQAEELTSEGNGELNVTEVTQVLIQMAYNYNGRNLKDTISFQMEKFNKKK